MPLSSWGFATPLLLRSICFLALLLNPSDKLLTTQIKALSSSQIFATVGDIVLLPDFSAQTNEHTTMFHTSGAMQLKIMAEKRKSHQDCQSQLRKAPTNALHREIQWFRSKTRIPTIAHSSVSI